MLAQILQHLEVLVSHNTTNPPRAISAQTPIIQYVTVILQKAGFCVEINDLGTGSVNVLAVRGNPRYLFNVHLDTVPADHGWENDPFSVRVESDRVIGLGACDIKGAASALLAAVGCTNAPAAVLLTTDEEAGQSRCIHTFIKSKKITPDNLDAVIVAEPTDCLAVTSHRGLIAAQIAFSGHAGHASAADADSQNAIHHATRWATAALNYINQLESNSNETLRFNLGKITGGTKANVIASNAEIVFGFRPQPSHNVESILSDLQSLATNPATISEWRIRFQAPALAPSNQAQEQIQNLDLESGEGVDFWTEAALFGAAGYPTFVLGPGNIAQAHTAGEYVFLTQLQKAAQIYLQILNG